MKTIRRKCFIHKTFSKPFFKEDLNILNIGEIKLTYSFCKKCGLVYQSNSLKKKYLSLYYSNFHFDFSNKVKPTLEKKKNLERYFSVINQEFKVFPKSILEVSLMNLFTLKKFLSHGSKIVHGLEPNLKLKNKRFKNIKIINQTIENFKSNQKYDLILMAHVLEHLIDPQIAIKNCRKLQKIGQKILIEVPLFDKIDLYPLAGFTMEHLHYFSEENMKYLLQKNGYKILNINKLYYSTQMPFLTIMAEKSKHYNFEIDKKTIFNQKINYLNYVKIHSERYNKIKKTILKIKKNIPTFLYGAGMTSSSFIYHSSILDKLDVKGIFDSNPDKQGKMINNLKIMNFDKYKLVNKNIIITSEFSAIEIAKKIKSKLNNIFVYDRKKGLKKIS